MLQGKCVILGVTGGIAAYKAAELLRLLVKSGAETHVVMTRSAQEFVTPLTFQTLSGNPVHTELFSLIQEQEIGHISLADRADLVRLDAGRSANLGTPFLDLRSPGSIHFDLTGIRYFLGNHSNICS